METERPILVREFVEASVAAADGRNLDIRIVPYDVPARVADPPDFQPYDEMFVRGAFERQARAAGRVKLWLNFEHETGLRGIIGHGVEIEDRADALYGRFRMHSNPDADKALALVNEGLLPSVSLEFAAIVSRVVDGITRRVRAHIDRVSLVREGAYPGAGVLAVREALDLERLPSSQPALDFDPTLAVDLEGLGLAVPDRLKVATPTE